MLDKPSRRRERAAFVDLTTAAYDEIVDQRIGGAGVESDNFAVGAEIGYIADAAPVKHGQRPLGPRRLSLRDRGGPAAPLAAGCDIGGAEIIDDVDSEASRRARPVAELDVVVLRFVVSCSVTASPLAMGHWTGAAPRQRGSSEACTLTTPSRGRSMMACGRICP